MANAFGFKTKTDYSDVTAARQRQTAQTALQLKDAMKNVSSTIIEKRIAKKYDDPYSIEAMKERQVSYAGIDPTRSEQARKYINDAMTQQRLNVEQEYKKRAEGRDIRRLQGTEDARSITAFSKLIASELDVEEAVRKSPTLARKVADYYGFNVDEILTGKKKEILDDLGVNSSNDNSDKKQENTGKNEKGLFSKFFSKPTNKFADVTDEKLLTDFNNLYTQRAEILKENNLPPNVSLRSRKKPDSLLELDENLLQLEKELNNRNIQKEARKIKQDYNALFR